MFAASFWRTRLLRWRHLGCMIDESINEWVRLSRPAEHPGTVPGLPHLTLTGATRRRIWSLNTAAAF
jgi:hypothetical protein